MKRNIPDRFGIDEILFKTLFSAPSFRIFTALVIGWVLGKHTVQVILTMKLHESRHFGPVLGKGPMVHGVSQCLFRIMVETCC